MCRGADKSLAWPDWKNNWKVTIFRPTRRSLLPRRPGWTENLLNCFWVACKSSSLVAVAFFLPGRAKDLSALRVFMVLLKIIYQLHTSMYLCTNKFRYFRKFIADFQYVRVLSVDHYLIVNTHFHNSTLVIFKTIIF